MLPVVDIYGLGGFDRDWIIREDFLIECGYALQNQTHILQIEMVSFERTEYQG